ncbi:hypothetical protein BCV72DRAFT_229375 [Rhizopus microsporus var. microsporus]|uniref:MutL C-terminal dimerisation domain-containing protein n=2 Tax=Rhizopus microsporus TaxID=58291 RepID=A0A2G4SLE4_RHIZD|nr:uncharacterized protein RHIMIDRAFT_261808 [Rhizopus microsporus ATCC 52813]ORE05686.1 hypothetical protein BCV72DRAFT_229375 [Rhizopus microsporus var. microsporus]PHZ09598.1 hypothetical protein RHIMIDRAFT_261808 [Rhizopus microsporus ATCC 52813]
MSIERYPIEPLDSSVVYKLRSSLVISTLTECVKELVQNAIDAEASSIHVSVDTEKFSIQVSDNGIGIENMSQLGRRHVSSKCHSLKDLSQLKTFGFRGEALASIMNESIVKIISRYRSSTDTFEAVWRESKLMGEISKHTRMAQSGTIVIVKDLFYKYPVRRRQASTPYQYVVMMESVKRLLTMYALCFPCIQFTLIDGTRETRVLSLKKTSSSIDTFRQIAGPEIIKYIEPLEMHEDNINIRGFFSTHGYLNKTYQYLFINNYCIPTTNDLYKVISNLFLSSFKNVLTESNHTTKQKDRRNMAKHPIFFIKLECDKWNSYDISIHLDIFDEFSEFHYIKTLLQRFTRQFLTLSGLTTEKDETVSKKRKTAHSVTESIISGDSSKNPYVRYSSSSSTMLQPTNPTVTWADPETGTVYYIDPRTGHSFLAPPATPNYPFSHASTIDRSSLKRQNSNHDNNSQRSGSHISSMTPLDNSQFGTFLSIPNRLSREDLKSAKVLGQVDCKFIAIKLDDKSILMMDQHAADERIKLESMMKSDIISRKTVVLEPYIPFDLNSAAEYEMMTNDRILEYLKIWGIHLVTTTTKPIASSISDDTIILSSSHYFSSTPNTKAYYRVYVTRLPELIVDRCITNHALIKTIIRDYVYWIVEQQYNPAIVKTNCPKGMVDILKSKACRSAIMFNDPLSLEQCQDIVDNLSKASFPFQCAHGRPSVIPLSLSLKPTVIQRTIHWDKFKL